MTNDEESNLLQRLKTVTIFGESGIETERVFDIPKCQSKVFSQSSLLVESLIDYICGLIEKDSRKQKKLYLTVCQKLYELGLIDKSYLIKDLDFIRINYQKELYQLVSVAQSVSPVIQRYDVPVPTTNVKTWSRYATEYHELEFIASGGFGEVVKAQNKLDAGIYAIKKICIRYCSPNGFYRGLSEVQMLAKLNHPNIVSYKAAWLERLQSSVQRLIKKPRKALCELADRSTVSKLDGSSDIIFASSTDQSTSETNNKNNATVAAAVESLSFSSKSDSIDAIDNNVVTENLSSNTRDNNEVFDGLDEEPSRHECGQDWAVLFIQMQLCHQTLRQWLDCRNFKADSPIDLAESYFIFSQIVKGVEFIHSKGIVHHDIKPNNIFIGEDGNDVQVGDFGLSCCLLHNACPDTPAVNIFSSPNCPVSYTRQGGEIGTRLYAAPEQLNRICDSKSDLYSLGIVLFELVYCLRTDMERVEKINDLRTNISLPPNLELDFPAVAKLIKRLVSPNPEIRPTATELLEEITVLYRPAKYEENESKSTTIRNLERELKSKNEEIASLKRKILALQAESTSQ